MLNSTFLFMFFMTVSLPEPRVHWFGKNSCPAKLRDPSVSTAHQHKTSKVPSFFVGWGSKLRPLWKHFIDWATSLTHYSCEFLVGFVLVGFGKISKQNKQTDNSACHLCIWSSLQVGTESHLIVAVGGDLCHMMPSYPFCYLAHLLSVSHSAEITRVFTPS